MSQVLSALCDTLINHQRTDTDCVNAPSFKDLEIVFKDNDAIEIKYLSRTLQLWMIFQHDPEHAPSEEKCFRMISKRKVVSPSYDHYTPCVKFFKVSRDWKDFVEDSRNQKPSKLLIEKFFSLNQIINQLEKHL